MRELFDQLIVEGEAGIDRIINERTLETVQLDFKVKRTSSNGRFEDEDKRVFGKALSAFSNSAGGLLIWGIDARRGEDGIDCAQPPGHPISDIEQFHVEAIRLSGDLLMPRHDGITVATIPSMIKDGSGYLLVYVDRSERRPHRCEAKGDKHYYKRAGDSSFVMEHYDIEDAFRRYATPTLTLEARFLPRALDGAGNVSEGLIQLFLRNHSAVTAKMPYLQLKNVAGGRESANLSQIISHTEGEWRTFSGEPSVVVHPGLSRSMASYLVQFEWPNGACKIEGNFAFLWYFHADCRFGCEDASASTVTIDLDEKFLVQAMQGTGSQTA